MKVDVAYIINNVNNIEVYLHTSRHLRQNKLPGYKTESIVNNERRVASVVTHYAYHDDQNNKLLTSKRF